MPLPALRMPLRFLSIIAACLLVVVTYASETKILPLSGLGETGEAPVFWDFKIDNGRRSGEWTTIRVPSCWETEGFGTFYYGVQGRGKPDTDPIIPKEHGTYRTKFTVPADWQGQAIRIVFEAAMTDTTVTINGQPAGPTHQGGFYRFHYDITSLVKIGAENTLEVLVSKESANTSVNRAERRGDYWTFGGIYRPVWLEARPQQHIEWTAIDARADGSFTAEVHLSGPQSADASYHIMASIADKDGAPEFLASERVAADAAKVVIRGVFKNPKLWTAETPHLYEARFKLTETRIGPPKPGKAFSVSHVPVHTVTERFGFRTFEVRKNDGLYLNGTKIVLKGVNRHCFWPETGRTVTREQSYADARLIKAGNMNAVRMAHYPPDKHFLEACDELGLYVLDELAGWQGFYDTPTGARLIGQIVRRDVNHPSILFWNNGNEGGWNTANDGEFAKWDPQKRPVLHPWAVHSDINTDHYEKYASTVKLSAGPQIFMPTEFLHGLYDGGIGAGFRDFWDVMGKSPTVAGGFFWVWSDEGVVRSDQGGRIDNFGNNAPDGMVGPHRDLEGSYHAVKEIWSPVQIKVAPSRSLIGWRLSVENAYDFTDLGDCTAILEGVRLTGIGAGAVRETVFKKEFRVPAIAPRRSETWEVAVTPAEASDMDWAQLTIRDKTGNEIGRWHLPSYKSISDDSAMFQGPATAGVSRADGHLIARAGETIATFDEKTGELLELSHNGTRAFSGRGPQFVALRRQQREYSSVAASTKLTNTATATLIGGGEQQRVTFTYEGSLRSVQWDIGPKLITLSYEFSLDAETDIAGIRFDIPDNALKSKRWLGRGPYRVWQNRQEGGVFDLHEVAFNDPIPGQTYAYPEFKGFFREWRWLSLETTAGRITVENVSAVPFFALGKIKSGEKDLITDWPDMGLAFLHAIPAIGTKFDSPEVLGPQSQPAKLNGVQRGTLIFRFE